MSTEGKKTRQVLSQINFLSACDKVRAMQPDEFKKFKNFDALAQYLTKELGFIVTTYHANQVMTLTKLKLPNAGRAPRGTGVVRENNKLRYMARELNRLLIKLGEPSSDKLVQIGMGYTPDGIEE